MDPAKQDELMQTLLVFLVIAVIGIVLLRQWLLERIGPPPALEPFDGDVYMAGKAAIIAGHCANPQATVICIPGFCENLGYFTGLYNDPNIQLIALVSCDYHLPVADPRFMTAAWARAPHAPEGSVAYDAKTLLLALENLPRSSRVRVHGHSRGGAVVLEAALLRPDLFRDVEVVLEAPVLPRALPKQAITAPVLWLLPLFVPLWRRYPINNGNRHLWGSLDSPRKQHVIRQLPFNPRRASTMLANLRSLRDWVEQRDHGVYGPLVRGIVLVPGDDCILDPESMYDSASRASALTLREVDDCSHFVLLDRPDQIPEPGD